MKAKWSIEVCLCLMCITVLLSGDASASTDSLWLSPAAGDLSTESAFDVEVHIDTGGHKLGAYQFDLVFDRKMINVDTTLGKSGAEAGHDGFISAVNTDNNAGKIAVGGFDIGGVGPADDLALVIIHFRGLSVPGTVNIGFKNIKISDEKGDLISADKVTGGDYILEKR